MNWDRIRSNWKQVTGIARAQWHKFTDEELDLLGSRFDQLVDRVRERDGMAQRQAAEWERKASEARENQRA